VILLHGLGRTRLAMIPLAWRLKKQGYRVTNLGYFGPSGLEKAVARTSRNLERFADEPLDFVTHSMGGMVARGFLSRHPGRGRRLVQLAPPNRGSDLADRVRRLPFLGGVAAFKDLGQQSPERKVDLPEIPQVEVGVVAGQSFGPWLGAAGDGIVRVSETYLPEARDWIVVPAFHTVIMNTRVAYENVVHFLEEGAFGPGATRLVYDKETGEAREVGQPVGLLEAE
jgi:triacylglycerol lipase